MQSLSFVLPEDVTVVLGVSGLILRDKFRLHNPANVTENHQHAVSITPDLTRLPQPGVCRVSLVMILSVKFGSSWACWWRSWQTWCFCCSVHVWTVTKMHVSPLLITIKQYNSENSLMKVPACTCCMLLPQPHSLRGLTLNLWSFEDVAVLI